MEITKEEIDEFDRCATRMFEIYDKIPPTDGFRDYMRKTNEKGYTIIVGTFELVENDEN